MQDGMQIGVQSEFEIHYDDIYSGPFLLSDLVLLYLEKQLPPATFLFIEARGGWLHIMDYAPFAMALVAKQNQLSPNLSF